MNSPSIPRSASRSSAKYGSLVVALLAAMASASSAHAGDVLKANNITALNDPLSWTGGIAPTATDVAVWSSAVTGTQNPPIGASAAWQGIKFTNIGVDVVIADAASANTLTLGSAGINNTGNARKLTVNSNVTLSANQTWTNGTASIELVRPSASPMTVDLGGFTLTKLGNATFLQFGSGATISNGTINVNAGTLAFNSGSSRTITVSPNVNINVGSGAFLRTSNNSGNLTSSGGGTISADSQAAVTINNGGTFEVVSTNTTVLQQSGKLVFNGNSTLDNRIGNGPAGRMDITGELSVPGALTWKESGAVNATAQRLTGNLTGNGTVNFQNTSAVAGRRADWSGDNSAFAGTVNVNGASGNRNLRLTTATAGSSTATWAPAAGNTLEVDGVAVNLGTLNGAGTVTSSNATVASAITVGSGAFTGTITNGALANGMALTKTGNGTLTLTGANTYSGDTNVQGGILATTSAQTGGGNITVSDGATFAVTQASAGATFTAANLTLSSAGGATLNLVPASSPTAPIVTAPNFTVNGSAVIKVSGSPVSGTTLVDYTVGTGLAGLSLVMPFRSSAQLQDDTVNTNINLINVVADTLKWKGNVNGTWDTTTSNWITSSNSAAAQYTQSGVGQIDSPVFDDTATGTRAITLDTSVSPVGITVNNSGSAYSISGTGSINGTTSIVKNGSSALTLATANTFTGGVLLNAGTLNINNASAIGSGALTVAAGTTLDNTSGAAVTLSTNNTQNWNGDITFTGTNDLNLGTGSVALTADRQVTVNGNTLSIGGLSGVGFGLTKVGAGTLAVGSSSYTGATIVNGGTLKGTSAASFSTTSSVTLADTLGVALDLGGLNQTVSTITGGGATGGSILLNGAVLTTGTAADSTFAGALTGAGGLTKAGAGILTLSGNKSGYTGVTTVSAGTLDLGTINGTFGLPATVTGGGATNSIIVNGALFVQGNGLLTTGISGNAAGLGARGGNLTVNVGGVGGMINRNSAGSGGLGQMILGSPTSDSRIIIQNDIGTNNFGGTRDITVNSGTGTASAEITGVISPGGAGGNSGFVKKGDGDLILSNANTLSGSSTIQAGRLVLGHSQALQFTSLTTDSGGVLVATGFPTPTLGGLTGFTDLNFFISVGYSDITNLTLAPQTGRSLVYDGVIGEGATGMSLTKTGAGSQTLNGANTYTGGTSVLGGTLTIGPAGKLGANTAAPLVVGNTNTTVNGNAAVLNLPVGVDTTTGSLSGSIAAVALPLTGVNTATINNGGAGFGFTVNQTANGTYAGVIAGNGTFTLGSGSTKTLTLTGANTYTGITTLSGGTLALGDGTTTGSVAGDIVNNAALVLSPGPLGLPYNGVISGSGSVTVTGANTVSLGGANTYSGGTSVLQGVLNLANISGSATGTGAVSIGAAGALSGTGSLSGSVTVSGALAPAGAGAGTITLGSSLAFTSGSTLALDLGTASDQVAFASTGTLSGSGLPTLALTLGTGFDYAASYTILSNVSTAGFTFGAITGYDTATYNATVQKSGSAYVLSFPLKAVTPTYASWATDNGITGQPANGDFDNDGVANAVEMVLGGNPATVADTGLLPTIAIVTNPAGVPAGTYMEFTYRRTALSVSASVTSAGQYSTDLLAAWTTAVNGVGGVVTIETANFYATGVDRVQVYVPKGASTKLFGRLNVTVPVAP